jgi:hypothetical protein
MRCYKDSPAQAAHIALQIVVRPIFGLLSYSNIFQYSISDLGFLPLTPGWAVISSSGLALKLCLFEAGLRLKRKLADL